MFDVLIVWIDSRLGRNPDETRVIRKLFRSYGVQIYSVKRPMPITYPRYYNPSRDKYRHIMEGFNDLNSESESYEFSEKMQMGKMKVARDGKAPCKVPYGYKKKIEVIVVNGRDKAISILVEIEEELVIVRLIFNLYLHEGLGIRKILDTLFERGIKNRVGERFNYSTVRYMLKNPIYAGYIRWAWRLSDSKKSRVRMLKGHSGVIAKGEHRAIISPEDFEKVQLKIKERDTRGGGSFHSTGLLVGRLKCARCGQPAHTTSQPSSYAYQMEKLGKPKENFSRVRFYVCSKVAKHGNKACTRYIGAQRRLDNLVIEEVRKLASSDEAQKSFEVKVKQGRRDEIKVEIEVTEEKLKHIAPKRDRFHKAFGDMVLSYEDYRKQLADVDEDEAKLVSRLAELKKEYQESEVTQEKLEKALKAFRDFYLIWDKATMDKKKDLIASIIEKVVYKKNKLEIIYKI